MTKHEIRRSEAQSIIQHTISAAFSTVERSGSPISVTLGLQKDLRELNKLQSSPLVDAAKSLVEIAVKHSIKPTKATHEEARVARDALGYLMMNAKEIKG